MYKTIGQMGSDKEVANMPYKGWSLEWLTIMMEKQKFASMINTTINTGSSDLDNYTSLNARRMASPKRHRELLCLPPLTPEDINEYPESSRYIGEDPFWMEALKRWDVSYIQLGLTTRDLVARRIIQEEDIIQ